MNSYSIVQNLNTYIANRTNFIIAFKKIIYPNITKIIISITFSSMIVYWLEQASNKK